MKKKSQNESDIVGIMNKIQAQLAVLDRKLDAFMTKSLTELAQAKAAAQKPSHPMPHAQASSAPIPQRPARPMYAVVCFDCGKDTEIPFKPSGDRPVYCQECFSKRRAAKSGEPKPLMASSHEPMPTVNVPSKPAPVVVKKAAVKKAATKKKVVAKKSAKRK